MKIKMILFAAFSMASAALYAQNGNVGIGTAAPSAKLHVNGNMKLADAPQAGAAAVSSLVRDNATGEIKVAATATNSFPMSLITFQLSNVNGDWVADYDTKIPDGSYTVALIGNSFVNPSTTPGQNYSSLIPNTAQANTIAFDPLNVFAFKAAGTWHISADYRDAVAKLTNAPDGPGNNYNGTWTINCLVINNSLVQSLANVSQDLGGTNAGAAAAPPAGL